jgi:basic membrane lipoprotein Med (substrate-binding protein (PBP1-ABC) superfamily)
MKRFTVLAFGIVVLMVMGTLLSAQSRAGEKMKVAALYTTPMEEPYIIVMHQAILKAVEELNVEFDHTENVNPADYERVAREYADKGYEIIFLDAYGQEEAARRVGKDYPNIAFSAGSDLGPVAPNFSVFTCWIQEPTYLCGMIAGKMTKTNVLGVVAGYPAPIVNVQINAFRYGAEEVNPDVKVKIFFIESWFDPSKAKEAAIAQIEAGADFIFAERYGVFETAQKHKVLCFGNQTDQNSLAPNTVITGPVWDMWPTVRKVISDVRAKTYKGIDLRKWSEMAKGGAYLAPYHGFENKIPSDVKQLIEKRTQEIRDLSFVVPDDPSTPKSD